MRRVSLENLSEHKLSSEICFSFLKSLASNELNLHCLQWNCQIIHKASIVTYQGRLEHIEAHFHSEKQGKLKMNEEMVDLKTGFFITLESSINVFCLVSREFSYRTYEKTSSFFKTAELRCVCIRERSQLASGLAASLFQHVQVTQLKALWGTLTIQSV